MWNYRGKLLLGSSKPWFKTDPFYKLRYCSRVIFKLGFICKLLQLVAKVINILSYVNFKFGLTLVAWFSLLY